MRFANRAILAGGIGFAVSALAGCGSNGSLLTQGQASNLKSQLAQISQALGAGHCQTAQSEIQNFQSTVDGLGGVDQTLIGNLDQGASTIAQLTSNRCQSVHVPTTSTSTTPPTTTSTSTTPTTPTSTSTTPTTRTDTTPTTPTSTSTTPTTTTATGTTSTTGGTGLSGGGGASTSPQGGNVP